MKTFECPSCHQVQEAIAIGVGHRCPCAHNKWVEFKVVELEAAK